MKVLIFLTLICAAASRSSLLKTVVKRSPIRSPLATEPINQGTAPLSYPFYTYPFTSSIYKPYPQYPINYPYFTHQGLVYQPSLTLTHPVVRLGSQYPLALQSVSAVQPISVVQPITGVQQTVAQPALEQVVTSPERTVTKGDEEAAALAL